MNKESHEETIICPSCGNIQIAEVFHTCPWWTYIHCCEDCEYYIIESEWENQDEISN